MGSGSVQDKMKKKSRKNKIKKKRIIYHEPPMKYNVALHQFEVNLPTIKRDSNKEVDYRQFNILLIILLIIVVIYLIITKL